MRKLFQIFVIVFFVLLPIFVFGDKKTDIPVFSVNSAKVLGVSEENQLNVNEDFSLLKLTTPTKEPLKPVLIGVAPPPNCNNRGQVIMDVDSGDIIYAQNKDVPLPIASISKLMTALVFLDMPLDLNDFYIFKPQDRRNGGRIYLLPQEKVKVIDLLNLSLVASANSATAALVDVSGKSEEEFVLLMNKKAADIGLKNTFFSDPIGFSRFNRSTPKETAKLVQAAFDNELIRSIVAKKSYNFKTASGRSVKVLSTDFLLHHFKEQNINILGGKTGYTNAAGYCFAGIFNNNEDHKLISVVLGAEKPQERFRQTAMMVKWAYDNYEWK